MPNFIRKQRTQTTFELEVSIFESIKDFKKLDLELDAVDDSNLKKVRHFLNTRTAKLVSPNLNNMDKISAVHVGVLQYFFSKFGKKIFSIDENLIDYLLLTDSSKVDSEFLNLPFPCIMLYFDKNEKIKFHNSYVEYVVVYLSEEYENEKNIKISTFFIDKTYISFDLTIYPGDILTQVTNYINKACDNYTVEIHQKVFKDRPDYSFEQEKENKIKSINKTISLVSFIVSILLYMKTSEAKLERVLPLVLKKSDSRNEMCKITSKIPIINNPYKNISNFSNEKNENYFKILKWTVRGHFRNQPKGTGRKERELIWIRPFIKGRERLNKDINTPQKEYKLM